MEVQHLSLSLSLLIKLKIYSETDFQPKTEDLYFAQFHSFESNITSSILVFFFPFAHEIACAEKIVVPISLP